MKAQKILNILLMILIILLISIVSFGGIYVQKQEKMVNVIPDYQLGINLKGYRYVSLKLSDTQPSDDDENTVSEDNTTEGEVTSTTDLATANETNTASDENATDENSTENNTVDDSTTTSNAGKYRKAAEIFRKRLKKLGVEDYTVSVDENSGEVYLALPDNERTDIILSDITQIGKFTIIDSESKEKLITNDDVKSVNVKKQTSGTSSTTGEPITYLYLEINFNLSGTKKFTSLSQKYQNIVNETNTSTDANSSDTANVEEEANTETESSTNETNTTSGSTTAPEVTLKIDDTELMSTYFSSINDTGTLTLTIGNSAQTTTDFTQREYAAENLAAIMENDPLPYQYEVNTNVYINSNLDNSKINIIIYVEIGIELLISLIFIIKYRANGVFSIISTVGYIALLLIAVRYGNVVITLEGLLAFELAFILNLIYNILLLSKLKEDDLTGKERVRAYRDSMIQYILIQIPLWIIIVSFAVISKWATLNSMGLVLFLASAISLAYNAIVSYLFVKTTNKQ